MVVLRYSGSLQKNSIGRSVALSFIKTPYVEDGAEFDVAILGKPHRATLHAQPLFDPKGERLRA